ncbi:RRG9 [Candida theae]|uniref:Required for respiratory growth protein 9, mitochondrial n=1 Tax=Candida theae TaxID=1198502 RepID=A0AAD5BK07_9ASCO|nr:RRG9 [Candida theae]KAI5968154.1 RRG9 [Candida theae]
MIPLGRSFKHHCTAYASFASLKPVLFRYYLLQCRFKSNIDPLLKSTATHPNTQSLQSPKRVKNHEPKTLLEEMKLADQSRQVDPPPRRTIPPWVKRELTQKSKYDRWNPKRRLSRQEMIKVKELKETFPQYRTVDLAQFFHISPEAVRRILRSKWVPNDIDEERITQRKERKLLQKLENKQMLKREDGGSDSHKRGKRFQRKNKFENDSNANGDEDLNKHYNRIQSQF